MTKQEIYDFLKRCAFFSQFHKCNFEICNFCKKENLEIDGWIEETISGTKTTR